MTKTEYMKQLQNKLKRLPKEDYDKAIEYYEEYFADAGVENEEQAIEDLGNPQEAADQIIREFAIDNGKSEKAKKDVKKGFSQVWVVVLALCASPIALPLLIAIIAVLFALGVMAVAFFFSFGLAGITLVLSGILSLAGIITAFSQSFPIALICLGTGCVLVSLGILIIYSAYLSLRKFLYWIVVTFGKRIAKGEKKNEKE